MTGGTKALVKSGFTPPTQHIDIQSLFGSKFGMSTLAGEMIDPSYHEIKENFPTYLDNRWHLPLCKKSLDYAAVDGYVSFELYNRIQTMKDGLDPIIPITHKKNDNHGGGTSRSSRRERRGG